MTETFDYVVVGGGSGGCAVASRLSETPGMTVALLEAGGFARVEVDAVAVGDSTVEVVGDDTATGAAQRSTRGEVPASSARCVRAACAPRTLVHAVHL